MKYLIILITIFFLFSCESEKDPCDIEYQLNEPGGFGRNEVTFMIDDSVLWHSSQLIGGRGSVFSGSVSGGGSGLIIFQDKLRNENGTPIFDTLNKTFYYLNNYNLRLYTRNSNECKDYYFKNYELEMFLSDFSEDDNVIDRINFRLVNYFIDENKHGYGGNKLETMNCKVYWNRRDSIIHGTFDGEIYGKKQINGKIADDTLKITKGVFDYRYKAHNFNGEL